MKGKGMKKESKKPAKGKKAEAEKMPMKMKKHMGC